MDRKPGEVSKVADGVWGFVGTASFTPGVFGMIRVCHTRWRGTSVELALQQTLFEQDFAGDFLLGSVPRVIAAGGGAFQ